MAKKEIATNELDALVQEIRKVHEQCFSTFKNNLDHARNAGELLCAAKELCKHGDWQAWLTDSCEMSTRSAQIYMRIFGNWDEINLRINAKSAGTALLDIESATKLIAKPPRKPRSPKKKNVSDSQPAKNEDAEIPDDDKTFPDEPEEDTGPEGEIPPEFEGIFATRQDFNNIVHFLARIQELPYILRNSKKRITEDFLPKISGAIVGFPEGSFSTILENIEKAIVTHRLVDLVETFLEELKEWKPYEMCSCYKDGKADPGCENCAGYGYRPKR